MVATGIAIRFPRLRHVLSLLWMPLVWCGCGEGKRRTAEISNRASLSELVQTRPSLDAAPSYALTASREFGDSLSWAFPQAARIVGQTLVVSDRGNSRPISVVDLKSGQIVASFGGYGRGPAEFRSITWFYPHGGATNLLWAFDPPNDRFSLLGVGDSVLGRVIEDWPYHPSESVFYPVFFGDSIIGGGPMRRATLVVTDRNGRVGRTAVVDKPFTEEELGSSRIARMANHAVMTFRPGSGEIALGYNYASRIDLFARAGTYLKTLAPSARPIRVGYEIRFGQATGNADNETAYEAIYGTSRYLYALYCGCTKDELLEGAAPREIQVWNWTGELVATVTLDRAVLSIAVSDDDSVLVGMAWEPAPSVIQWALPGLLQQRAYAVAP